MNRPVPVVVAPSLQCGYCGNPDVRERPDPFGGEPCCERCFNDLIGGAE